jgi:hypothetical protein
MTTEEEEVPLQMRALQQSAPEYQNLFRKVFSEEAFQGLPPRWKWDHQINLVPRHSPLRGKCYLLATREQQAMQDFIETNLAGRKIKASNLPYVSPFFFRLNPETGELRGIQDYQKLNKITVKDRYPLPLITDVLAKAQGSRVFTKMDLRWGFNNVQIREGDEHKVAFITPQGLFEPNIMQFGLCNALLTFQQMINEVLVQEKNLGHVEVYVDDILVHTTDLESNQYWTGRVLSRLEENNLHCRLEKCQFKKEEVEFLGVLLSEGSLKVSP